MTFDDLPEMLRVEEAAGFLRISRTRAYDEVAIYRRTHGERGLPSIAIGRCLRIPKPALARWIDAQLGTTDDA